MSRPRKNRGFNQGLYEISSTAKERVGTKRETADGRVYRYAKNGATDLVAGKLTVAAAINAYCQNEAMTAAAAIGTRSIDLTLGGSSTYAENYFRDGMFQINDATGEGYQYPIAGSSAVASGTALTITLEETIRVALDTTSEWTLAHNPWMAVVIGTAGTYTVFPTGIPPVAVTAAYYFWCQTGGLALCLVEGTAAIGSRATLAATSTTYDGGIDQFNTTTSTSVTQPLVGIMLGYATTDTEYTPVWLTID
jgi:hypothetical protein